MGLLPFTHYDSCRDIDHISKFQSIKQNEPITIQTIWLMSWYWLRQQVKTNRTKWGYYLLHSVTEGVIFIISTNENLSNNTGLSPFIIIILCLFFVLDIENVKLSSPSHHKLDSVWQRILKQNFICHIKSAFAVVFLLCCFLECRNLVRQMHLFCYRSWCPDRTSVQAREYISHSLGRKFTEAVILDLEAMLEETNPRIPLIALLSMGSDPTNAIENVSKRLEIRKLLLYYFIAHIVTLYMRCLSQRMFTSRF